MTRKQQKEEARKQQIEKLEKLIKNARRNASRQRNRQQLARHTRKDCRVRPEFWEQAERDYRRQLTELQKKS